MVDPSAPAVPRPLVALRLGVAILLGIHGYSRALTGGVIGFGGFLTMVGFPSGFLLAAAITAFEMIGSLCLFFGRFVRVVTLGFAFNLAMGIALVHAKEGWFVVGGGRNGVEYSVLLITCLLVLFAAYRPVPRPAAGSAAAPKP